MKITLKLPLLFFTILIPILIQYLLFPSSIYAEDLNCYNSQNQTLLLYYDELYLEAGTDLVIHISRGSDSEIDCSGKTVYVCLEPRVFGGEFVCDQGKIPITLDANCNGQATTPSPSYGDTYNSVVLDGFTYGTNNYCSDYVPFETYGGEPDCLITGSDCCLDELGWCLKPGDICCNVCPGYYCGFNGKVYPIESTTCGYLNTPCCLDSSGKVAGSPCFGDLIPSDTSNPSACACGKVPEPIDTKLKCTTDNGLVGINTAAGCIPIEELNTGFLGFILTWSLGILGGLGILLILYSAFLVITSAGNPKKLQAAKEQLIATLTGIALVILSVYLLRVIGVDILRIL